ncbi:MAG: hypothetical protein ABSE59_00255 [Opitutaceae bacterium]|jgi:hypothetical protein
MTKFFFVTTILAAGLVLRVAASPEAVIARARAYLGPEAALKAIHSIHYVGTLAGEERAQDPAGRAMPRPFTSTIDIIFQRPYRQRFTLVSSTGTEVTALDDFEAWRRLQSSADSAHPKLFLLNKGQIKYLRANVWENLSFFRDIERRGGHVEDLGPATIDGHVCEELVFVHEPGIKFFRYFDATTGQLVLTRLMNGDRFSEKGEVVVNGVRFPKVIVNVARDPTTGKEVTRVITLDKITLNESFPDSAFAVPMYSVQ